MINQGRITQEPWLCASLYPLLLPINCARLHKRPCALVQGIDVAAFDAYAISPRREDFMWHIVFAMVAVEGKMMRGHVFAPIGSFE